MSFCIKCGEELSEAARFCGACGHSVGTEEVASVCAAAAPVELVTPTVNTAAMSRTTVTLIVATVLVLVGFVGPFKTNESGSGISFVQTQVVPDTGGYYNEYSPRAVPALAVAYLVPLAGLMLGYAALMTHRSSESKWIMLAFGSGALAIVGTWLAWSAYFKTFGTNDADLGLGSYSCLLGGVVACWAAFPTVRQRFGASTAAGAASEVFQAKTLPPVEQAGPSAVARAFMPSLFAGAITIGVGYSAAIILAGGDLSSAGVWLLPYVAGVGLTASLAGVVFAVVARQSGSVKSTIVPWRLGASVIFATAAYSVDVTEYSRLQWIVVRSILPLVLAVGTGVLAGRRMMHAEAHGRVALLGACALALAVVAARWAVDVYWLGQTFVDTYFVVSRAAEALAVGLSATIALHAHLTESSGVVKHENV